MAVVGSNTYGWCGHFRPPFPRCPGGITQAQAGHCGGEGSGVGRGQEALALMGAGMGAASLATSQWGTGAPACDIAPRSGRAAAGLGNSPGEPLQGLSWAPLSWGHLTGLGKVVPKRPRPRLSWPAQAQRDLGDLRDLRDQGPGGGQCPSPALAVHPSVCRGLGPLCHGASPAVTR